MGQKLSLELVNSIFEHLALGNWKNSLYQQNNDLTTTDKHFSQSPPPKANT
ncbi:MAG: hypothetical protein ACOVQ4_16545 [Flectobacillus sp.]|uniref:hypothetical protein n=1 Tax=Flectobacillus sp. TaxID=50419 RepID=UPI003B99C50C